MRQYKLFFMSCLIFTILTIQAGAAEVLTWEDCVKEALENHPDLVSAQEDIRQAKADKNITRSAMLPQVTSRMSATKSQTSTRKETNAYSYSVNGEQLVFDGLRTPFDIGSASETLNAQMYKYAVESSNIRLNVRNAFVTLLRGQELIYLTEEIGNRRKQNLELVRLRYEAGREHKGALLTAEADLAEAQFEVSQAKRNLSLAQRELTKELGRKKKVPIEVKGDFHIKEVIRETPDFEALADTTPFLKELIARKEAARFDLKSAGADFFPQVYLNGSYGKSNSDWPPKDSEWSTGLSLSFPIFEGGSRIAQVSKARSQFKQAQAYERSGRDSVILTLEETWINLQDAIDSVSVQKKYLDAAQERAKIASAQYSTGLITFDDWIIIEDNLVNAQKDFLNTHVNLLLAEAEWIQAKGGTLEYAQK
jgi:outer membrane protein TolC